MLFVDCFGYIPSLSLASLCLGSSKSGLGGAGGIFSDGGRGRQRGKEREKVKERREPHTSLVKIIWFHIMIQTHNNSSILFILNKSVVKPDKLLMFSHHSKVGLLKHFQRRLRRKDVH